MTDDERQLRDLAYPLIEQPFNRQKEYSVAGEYGVNGFYNRTVSDNSSYAGYLLGSRFRSPSARYAQLIDDIRNDVTRLPQFFETASRVVDIDQKRRKSLAFVSAISPEERTSALHRISENASLIARVQAKLLARTKAYRIALERLVIMTPSPQAVDAERSLEQLKSLLGYYRTHPAPAWAREHSLAASR
ncbi:MAG: hypothetical protein ABI830_01995 [Pseudolabrys sp.]